jgi:hypothetical protein
VDIDRVCSFRYEATVGNDNTVRLGGITIDIPAGPWRASHAKARVEVRQFLDGSWRVYYQDQQIAQHKATQFREPLRAFKRSKTRAKASKPLQRDLCSLGFTLSTLNQGDIFAPHLKGQYALA